MRGAAQRKRVRQTSGAMTEQLNLSDIYRQFLKGEPPLEEAAARIRKHAESEGIYGWHSGARSVVRRRTEPGGDPAHTRMEL